MYLFFDYKVLFSVLVGEPGLYRFQMFVKRLLTISGSPYRYISHYKRLSWHDARNYCKNRSGDLASIHNMVDQLRVMQQIKFQGEAWIGGKRELYDNKHVWTWSDATLFEYPLGAIHLRNK